jgi:3-oxoacyl-[acyl-carrier protein] reductase
MGRQTAIVTGAASGIGAGIVEELYHAGWGICALDIDAARLERSLAELSGGDGEAIAVAADITSAAEIDSAVGQAIEQFGSVQALINNAGIITPETPIDELDESAIDRVLTVNLKSQFLCCRAVVAEMKKRRYGRIVNIVSRSWLGGAGIAQYAASKAGVIGLTRSLALELGVFGITVNCVSPSLVLTPLFENMPAEEQQADLRKLQSNPIPRIGRVEDIAHAVTFFASERAGYVTGQHLYVSGGADLLTSHP